MLDFAQVAKSLGVLIDNKFPRESHIDKLHKSFIAQLRSLKRMKFLQVKHLEDIYFKMILPNITYCISVWGSCLALFEDLEKLHIKAARQIYDIPFNYADHLVLNFVKWNDLAYTPLYIQEKGSI